MPDAAALKRLLAELLDTQPEAIHATFPLRHPRLQSSAGRGRLAAAIQRQLGVFSPKVFTATHYGELEAAVLGTGAAGQTAAPSRPEPADAGPRLPPAGEGRTAGIQLGVDVELVENMPESTDFWSEAFYRTHFTPAEIAYCLRQEHPRMHFAARWCAKEALAKCDARYADLDPTTIQVAPLPDGQPVLERIVDRHAVRIDCAVSLSHTPQMAIAVVARSATSPLPPSPPPDAGSPVSAA